MVNPSHTRSGLLFTLVGPAGVGKNELMRYVMARTDVRQLPTATTRPMRPGEQEGREHYYKTRDEFQRMIDHDELVEHQEIHKRFYGMVRLVLEGNLDSGQSIIADIDVLGALYACQRYPDNAVSIFVQPPTIGSLIERMRQRGDEEAELSKRLLRVPKELEYAPQFYYVILNDVFEDAAEALLEIVTSELDRRAVRPPRRGVQLKYPFRYVAEAVPLFEGDALTRSGKSPHPVAVIGRDERPVDAAVRALRETLGIEAAPGDFEHGDTTDDDYVSPVTLDYSLTEDGEEITYRYVYPLSRRINAPPGWAWQPFSIAVAAVRAAEDA
jgi:guanylate kinase